MSTDIVAAPRTRSDQAQPAQTPPHAPEAGRIRRLLGPFYVTGVFWFRFHEWGVRFLPNWLLGLLMVPFVAFFTVVLINIRRAIGANLEAVLGPSGWLRGQARVFRTIWTFSWCLTERYERLATRRPFEIEIEGEETWNAFGRAPEGFVLLTAHLGAWEAGSMVPSAALGRPVHVVRESETDPRAQEFLSDLIRRAGGEGYITHFAEDPHLGMALLDALRRGEIVALQGDRPRTSGRTCEARLFGRPYALPVGPAALARAAGVPLLPVFIVRQGRRHYRCLIQEPIRVGAEGDRQAEINAALERFTAALEGAIRRTPHQWFCFRRLWR